MAFKIYKNIVFGKLALNGNCFGCSNIGEHIFLEVMRNLISLLLIRVFPTVLAGPGFPDVNSGKWLYLMVMISRVKIYFLYVGT